MNQALPGRAEVIIIGGGIIGASVAYYLARKGVRDVLLLERGMLGQGSTSKCVGGIRTQFSTEINIRFSLLSMELFRRFRAELGVDPEYRQVGYLLLTASSERWRVLERTAALLERMKVAVAILDPGQIRAHWPFLRVDDLLGGSFTPGDGYAGPYEVLQGYVRAARRMGVLIREGVAVTGIRLSGGKIDAVDTSTGEQVKTGVVVNAAGPYAAAVAALAGLDLPVRPLRRQVFFTDPCQCLPASFPMVVDLDPGWYMRREGEGLLLAGPQDSESSYNESVDLGGREWAAERSLHRVPVLEQARLARGWAGLYEISPDNHAVIGPFPEVEGFICAAGFSGHGFMHSPAAGFVVAEVIADGRATSLDIHLLRPQRFREGSLIYEPLTAFRT
jgi:sarcosine oxidase subunit beta